MRFMLWLSFGCCSLHIFLVFALICSVFCLLFFQPKPGPSLIDCSPLFICKFWFFSCNRHVLVEIRGSLGCPLCWSLCWFLFLPKLAANCCPFFIRESGRFSSPRSFWRSCCWFWWDCKNSCQDGSWLTTKVGLGRRGFCTSWYTDCCRWVWTWGTTLVLSHSFWLYHLLATFTRRLSESFCIGCFCFSLMALPW